MDDWSGDASLAALFASAFLAATVLPGGSELVLYAVLKRFPESAALAIAVATLGNTLGSLTTFALGRIFPQRLQATRSLTWVKRYGAATLLLAWVPIVGDALCAAAGWLRLPWAASIACIALGKLARYLVVAQAAVWL